MNTRPLTDDEQAAIIENIVPINDWKIIGPFCVDGRDGAVEFAAEEAKDHLFVQALGGSLLIAVIAYLAASDRDFDAVLTETLTELSAAGYGVGVHRGSHAHDDASDCGFADNLQKIIGRLADERAEIAGLIDAAAPGVRSAEVWDDVINKAEVRSKLTLPTGENMISDAHSNGANLQTLDGDHAEVAAVVNLADGTTLNTGRLVSQGLQSFNLDLWYVLEQARTLGLDETFVMHAALGLYVATEMVLVEDKKQIRLPILIHS